MEMIKTVMSTDEIKLIENCLEIIINSIDRGDLSSIATNDLEENILFHFHNGDIDNLLNFTKGFNNG